MGWGAVPFVWQVIRSLATNKGKKVIPDTVKKFGQHEYNITRDLYIKQNKPIQMSDSQIISKAREIWNKAQITFAQKSGKNVVDIKTGKSISSKKQYGGSVRKAQYDT